jgi:hypothetical protein
MLLLIGAADLDEPQHSARPLGEPTPLVARRLDPIDRVDDHIMPERQLFGCQRLHDQIGRQAGRFIPANPRPPHRRLDRIHRQHRASERPRELVRYRALASTGRPCHHDQHATTISGPARAQQRKSASMLTPMMACSLPGRPRRAKDAAGPLFAQSWRQQPGALIVSR